MYNEGISMTAREYMQVIHVTCCVAAWQSHSATQCCAADARTVVQK